MAAGRTVGIFLQWSQAQSSTDKYKSSCHKGFDTLDEAAAFMMSSGMDSTAIQVIIDDTESIPFSNYNLDIPSPMVDIAPNSTSEACSKSNSSTADTSDISCNIPDNDIDNSSDISMNSCQFCNLLDSEYMIQCSDCKLWIHYQCSHLPPYMLTLFRILRVSLLAPHVLR